MRALGRVFVVAGLLMAVGGAAGVLFDGGVDGGVLLGLGLLAAVAGRVLTR